MGLAAELINDEEEVLMDFTIGKEFTFQAAHQLPLHDGQCKKLHGHSYRVVVMVSGLLHIAGSKSGMVIDFGDVSKIWKEHIEPLVDHQYLNDTLPIPQTTAECIAEWMLDRLREELPDHLAEIMVQVWETPTSWAMAA